MAGHDASKLIAEASQASESAYCPYSNYKVGAALLAADGTVTRGCNVENASYGLTVCAERTAVQTAVAAGCREFVAIAIVASPTRNSEQGTGNGEPGNPSSESCVPRTLPSPCGACRQVLSEFCGKNFSVYVADADNLAKFEKFSLGDLLPNAFQGKRD